MAWEWSHSHEAYAYAEERLHHLPRKLLKQIYAEWKAHTSGEEDIGAFNTEKYDQAMKETRKLHSDVLADFIWERASEQATCTNGGWEAWLCPFGCGCHMVPFSPKGGKQS